MARDDCRRSFHCCDHPIYGRKLANKRTLPSGSHGFFLKKMNIALPVQSQVKSVGFSFYSKEELQKLSVLNITNPIVFDSLGHPVRDGLYDPRLGALERDTCETCLLDFQSCPGHFGRIELTLPVFNPINMPLLYKLLKSLCYYCHHLRIRRSTVHLYSAKLELAYAGLITHAMELDEALSADEIDERLKVYLKDGSQRIKVTMLTSYIKTLQREILGSVVPQTCPYCKGHSPGLRKDGMRIYEKPLSAKAHSQAALRNLEQGSLFGFFILPRRN
jgi:DNA-directed RNA polymerase I subunit RPA1